MRYELSYILKSDLEETKAKDITQDLVGFISKIGEEPKTTTKPKVLELAYPIKKQAQGFWSVLEFALEAKRLPELEKKLKDTKEIIRFMLTKVVSRRKNADKEAEKTLKRKESASNQRIVQHKISGQKKEEKAEIKDLDKKLDEILKEV